METEDLGLSNSPSRNDVSVGSAAKVQSPMMPDLSKDLHHNGEYSVLQISLLCLSFFELL